MSDKNNTLEQSIVEKLLPIDPYVRKTRGSGCGVEIGDISNKYFYIECKQKLTKSNIIVDYNKEYLKTLYKMPLRKSVV